jgi:isomaltose glucohydrolase
MFAPDPKLIETSLATIRAGQRPGGAYLAALDYPTYAYAWFRDGAFVAEAADTYGDRAGAGAFHGWVLRTLAAQFGRTAEPEADRPPPPDRVLHTRYRVDGAPGSDDWPNFQLDGFGTWLWAYARHVARGGEAPGAEARATLRRLTRYLTSLWAQPNFGCWEEDDDRVHPATLGAVVAGLRGAADLLDDANAAATAERVRAHLLQRGTHAGAFVKHVDGEAVDASLLWLAVPFGVVAPDDPRARATAARVRAELQDPDGGVKRYATDTFYGGGSWILLSAALARDALAVGEVDTAGAALAWIEAQADTQGSLPEQVARHLIAPHRYDEWVERWGPIARPLLWSHAAYLTAVAAWREAA